jgi:hypothetical protein
LSILILCFGKIDFILIILALVFSKHSILPHSAGYFWVLLTWWGMVADLLLLISGFAFAHSDRHFFFLILKKIVYGTGSLLLLVFGQKFLPTLML